ncbi:hypothetical protein [Zongyangia hominis]|uniref:Uncharacterized protein n=1 Tax=Zongyangia hominis TaxID=2763677 RepID=A0A926IBL4_9FIRM|nr:hypothetical protein [Zongyangia hominis]MBC8571366.1 hypothetical protein [Zongyangia hominis]
MAREQNRNAPSLALGGSSILMVFVILCLTTFAVLSLVSSSADWNLTRRTAQSVTDYYAADGQAERVLSGANQNLQSAWETSGGGMDAYYQAAADSLCFCSGMPFTVDGSRIYYSVPLGENQHLDVILEIVPPDAEGRCYRILSWQQRADEEGDSDEMQLWDPGDQRPSK